MTGESGRELLPLAHQPGQLLHSVVTLERDRAHAVTVGVEPRVAERAADFFDPTLEAVDLALDVLEAFAQLAQLHRALAPYDPRHRRGHGVADRHRRRPGAARPARRRRTRRRYRSRRVLGTARCGRCGRWRRHTNSGTAPDLRRALARSTGRQAAHIIVVATEIVGEVAVVNV